jgi:hypothetical protein
VVPISRKFDLLDEHVLPYVYFLHHAHMQIEFLFRLFQKLLLLVLHSATEVELLQLLRQFRLGQQGELQQVELLTAPDEEQKITAAKYHKYPSPTSARLLLPTITDRHYQKWVKQYLHFEL